MTTIAELFQVDGVEYFGVVPWGTEVPLHRPGVYVVALTPDATATAGLEAAPIDSERTAELVRARPEATVDGVRADIDAVVRRLQRMWVPGELAVYIGLAGASTRHRVKQFYSTRIGARAPHAGGWPVKMIDQSKTALWVHYGTADDPSRVEAAMVDLFVRGVSPKTAAQLVDPSAPLPFANLAFPRGRRKRHGFAGVKAPRASKTDATGAHAVAAERTGPLTDAAVPTTRAGLRRRTQNVTAKDIAGGQLRIPSVSKDVFPAVPATVSVRILGELRSAKWNPRTEGNRSGVIRLGVDAMRAHFAPGGPREVIVADGVFEIT